MSDPRLLSKLCSNTKPGERYLVGIAGPPGAGKSTLSAALAQDLGRRGFSPKVVPMDGYHLDNHTLNERGLLKSKGAPNTFDATAFVELIRRLRDANETVHFSTFDREKDCVNEDADTVTPIHDLLLIEGNYLLLDEKPWNQLRALFDFTVLINPGLPTLETRLTERWLEHGHSAQAARLRAMQNDLPNAERVLAASAAPDLVIK